MRYLRNANPAACSSKEESRYAIRGVAAIQHGDRTYLAATNGRCATMIRAYPEQGDVGYVDAVYPTEAFAAVRKATPKKAEECSLRLNGSATVKQAGASTDFAKVEGRFPDVFACTPNGTPACRFAINAELLAQMQAAFGSDGVVLEFHGEDMPLGVQPVTMVKGGYSETTDGSTGILMPIGKLK